MISLGVGSGKREVYYKFAASQPNLSNNEYHEDRSLKYTHFDSIYAAFNRPLSEEKTQQKYGIQRHSDYRPAAPSGHSGLRQLLPILRMLGEVSKVRQAI